MQVPDSAEDRPVCGQDPHAARLYLKALNDVMVADRSLECDCRRCRSTDDGKIYKGHVQHSRTSSKAIAWPKGDLREGDPHKVMMLMGRKSECTSFDCNVGGFGKEGGVPFCEVLEASEQTAEWKRRNTPLTKQLMTKLYKLCNLWPDFKKLNKVYRAHHFKAKWQANSQELCLQTSGEGDIVIETDVFECTLTCAKSS